MAKRSNRAMRNLSSAGWQAVYPSLRIPHATLRTHHGWINQDGEAAI